MASGFVDALCEVVHGVAHVERHVRERVSSLRRVLQVFPEALHAGDVLDDSADDVGHVGEQVDPGAGCAAKDLGDTREQPDRSGCECADPVQGAEAAGHETAEPFGDLRFVGVHPRADLADSLDNAVTELLRALGFEQVEQ